MTEQEAIEMLTIMRTFNNGSNAKVKAIDMAINALKKQIVKKPVIIDKRGLELDYKCPVCGFRVIEMQPIEN